MNLAELLRWRDGGEGGGADGTRGRIGPPAPPRPDKTGRRGDPLLSFPVCQLEAQKFSVQNFAPHFFSEWWYPVFGCGDFRSVRHSGSSPGCHSAWPP
jgi:hypothetical protein